MAITSFFINPLEYASMFAVPTSVVDKHIWLANEVQLKVLLFGIKNAQDGFDPCKIAEALKINQIIVDEALLYWKECGVLQTANAQSEPIIEPVKPKAKPIKAAQIKPTREQVARRGLENDEIRFLLKETEIKFGRLLRPNESTTIVWLYDDMGLSAALLIMLIEFSVSEGKPNIGFIERTAIEWSNDGVTDIKEAENRLIDMHNKKSAWHIVETAMGIEHRSPSKTELELANTWVNSWGFERPILRAAYETCVDNISKFSIKYIKKVLSDWHSANVKTVDDIAKQNSEHETKSDTNSDYYNTIDQMMYGTQKED